MKVDWKKASFMYREMFGEDLDVEVCLEAVEAMDDGDLADEDIIALLDIDNELSKGQLDCIAASLE